MIILVPSHRTFLRNLDIDWTYILPKAQWWGGFYERVVRTMKSSLKKVLGKSWLTFEEMETAVAEVEMMINSRPLTYIQDDVHEILTPSHLMLGRRLLTNNSFNVFTDKSKIDSCTKRLQLIAALLKHYLLRFRREYLNEF